ncbi:MAG: hypothetical protein ACRD1Z_12830, partial [Vicinamibacteria bacterium]
PPDRLKECLGDRDVFEVAARYDRRLVAALRGRPGIEALNQFGQSLRVIARRGAHSEDSIAEVLRRTGAAFGAVRKTLPSIEDVFVDLTHRSEGTDPQLRPAPEARE